MSRRVRFWVGCHMHFPAYALYFLISMDDCVQSMFYLGRQVASAGPAALSKLRFHSFLYPQPNPPAPLPPERIE